jgi:hypothetical protein
MHVQTRKNMLTQYVPYQIHHVLAHVTHDTYVYHYPNVSSICRCRPALVNYASNINYSYFKSHGPKPFVFWVLDLVHDPWAMPCLSIYFRPVI